MSKKIPERIFIQQFEDPKIEGFQEDDGATWWTSKVNEHDVEYVRVDHVTDVSKKVFTEIDGSQWVMYEDVQELEEKVSQLTDENDRLKKFAINLEFQTNTRMQNFMVQSVYDRINKDCREALKLPKLSKGGE